MRVLPYGDPMDPGYRRLFYVRYADDHMLGFTGPKAEAEQIKAKLAAFLRETLALELNTDEDPDHPRPHPARRGSSDIRSPSSTPPRNSPEASDRPTARSRCGSRRM